MIKKNIQRKATHKKIKLPIQRRISMNKIKLSPISPLLSSKENINSQLHSHILSSLNTLPKIPFLSNIHLIKTKELSPLVLRQTHILQKQSQGLERIQDRRCNPFHNLHTEPEAATPTGNILKLDKIKLSTENSEQRTHRPNHLMNMFERPKIIEVFKNRLRKDQLQSNSGKYWESVERDISSIKKLQAQPSSHSEINISMF